MFLQTLKEGDSVTIEVAEPESSYEIKTTIVGANNDGAILRAVYDKQDVVQLDSRKNRNRLFNFYCIDEDGSRKVFKAVNVITLNKKESFFYAVILNKFNQYGGSGERREDRRFKVDKKGYIVLGKGKKAEIKIHDISDGGISFYVSKALAGLSGQVNINFEDQVRGHYFRLGVPCSLVRKIDEEDRIFHGCRIVNKDQKLMEYLALRKET